MRKSDSIIISIALALALFVSGSGLRACADSLFSDKLFSDDSLFTPDNEPAKKSKEETELAEQSQQIARLEAQQENLKKYRYSVYDGMLFDQMRAVANWLDNYIVWNHRFPEQVNGGQDQSNQTFGEGDELTWALRQMNILIPNNPYNQGTIYAQGGMSINPQEQSNYGLPAMAEPSDSKLDQNRVAVMYVNTLKRADAPYYAANPPPDWVASPGTITIVTDRLYFFLLWGAGADGKPIRDPATGNARLYLGSYQTWDQPQMQP